MRESIGGGGQQTGRHKQKTEAEGSDNGRQPNMSLVAAGPGPNRSGEEGKTLRFDLTLKRITPPHHTCTCDRVRVRLRDRAKWSGLVLNRNRWSRYPNLMPSSRRLEAAPCPSK